MSSDSIHYIGTTTSRIAKLSYGGKRFQAFVPDTLDLEERAALAVNALTGATDPHADHEVYFYVYFGRNKPVMSHDFSDEIQSKFQEALPLMRLMIGSDLYS